MQPGNEQYGSRPERPDGEEWRGFERAGNRYPDENDADTDTDEWSTGRYPAPVPRARVGLLLLLAFFVEFLIIVGGGNQWVADKIAQSNPATYMAAGLRNVALVYSWRFTPRDHDTAHVWLAGLALIVTTIVVSLLLIFAIIRGPITFGRAFFGTWMAVTVATMLGGYVRGLVLDETFIRGQGSRGEMALFGSTSPGSVVFLAGLVLGLIVAIVLGIVAPVTRRVPEGAAVAAGPGGRPGDVGPAGAGAGLAAQSPPEPGGAPWQDQYYGPPPRRDQPDRPDRDGEETTRLPSLRKDEAAAAQRGEEPGAQRAEEPAAQRVEQPTAQREEPAAQQAGPADGQQTAALPAAPPQQASAQQASAQQAPAQQASGASQQTTQLPRMPDADPGSPQAPGGSGAPPAGAPPQQQFPRPPDDEDLDPEHH